MATRKQSNPNKKAGAMAGFQPDLGFAGPEDRTPAPLPKLAQVPGTPGVWSYQDRQAYVDSRPGSEMWKQNGSHLRALAMADLARIDAEEKARRDAEANSRRRY